MWGSILSAIVKGLGQVIMDWWRAEQAESAKWAAKTRERQLISIKEGKKIEQDYVNTLQKARKNPARSGALWNAKVTILLLLCPFILCGCFRFHVYAAPYRPVPPKIERPILENESPFSEREQKLVNYASELETVYSKIRQEAIESNQKNGYPSPEE